MNATSRIPGASSAVAAPETKRVLVWDAPVRVFHWLMVACFAGAWATADHERWMLVHATLGYTMAGLVAFRLVWGFVGTRHARFAAFVRGPRAVARHVGSMLRGRPEHPAGHNPAGAAAIISMLALVAVTVAAGVATHEEVGGHWLEELHEGAAHALLALVGVHVAGVVVGSWLQRANLVASMIGGMKVAPAEEAIHSAWRSVAVLLLAAVLAFWSWQWSSAPAPAERPVVERDHGDDD